MIKKVFIRKIFYCLLAFIMFSGCKKEKDSKVEFYMLKSFNVNQITSPRSIYISNAVLADTPFVRDENIAFYDQAGTRFKLKNDIKNIIKDYGVDKAFAVTVNNQTIYYGTFHSNYLSSTIHGLVTFDPGVYDNFIMLQFAGIGNPNQYQADKRNDRRIINAFKSTGRLR